ncbi:hypothetical protein PAL_GLEAN10022973 [Pteropus alecto]|uniref:Uncharacterized protein n=1 Tax=Pteropus alecto TaxID=9402 RepID=L5K5H4_PTEAL|nr:hypothetical protein PAL_GLEAN10022973 [Pteropus alecto]
MRDSTHVGQVELLVPAEVVLVSPAVWQWGAEGRTGCRASVPAGPTEQPQHMCRTSEARAQDTVLLEPRSETHWPVPAWDTGRQQMDWRVSAG